MAHPAVLGKQPAVLGTQPASMSGARTGWKRILTAAIGPHAYRAIRQTHWAASTELRDRRFGWAAKLRAWRAGFLAESAALYEFPREDWRDYLSDYVRENHGVRLNAVPQFFDQKLMLRSLLLCHGFRQTDTFALVSRGAAQLDPLGRSSRLVTLDALEDAMRGDGGPFIVKPQDAGLGYGVSLVSTEGGALVRRRGGQTAPFRIKSPRSTAIVERRVAQHEFWETLFPASANTLRVLTLWTPGEAAPFIAAAGQRIGASDTAPTDNFSGGGLVAPVDADHGTLGAARRRTPSGPPQKLTHHPETGARIQGATLPYWDRIRATALRAASVIGVARYVGWDIMVDTEGVPVIIEGNSNTGVHILQLECGLLKDPAVRRFYEVCGVL